MQNLIKKISLAGLIATVSSGAFAGVFSQSPDPASVAQGASVQVDYLFAGDGVNQDVQLDLNYNATIFTGVTATALVAGSTCGVNPAPPFIRIVPPSGAGVPLTSTPTAYCRFTFTSAAGAIPGNYDLTQRFIDCTPACTLAGNFRLTVTAPAGNTPPTIMYAPGTGTTINYTGGGTASPIVATPSGGTGSGAAATTTVGACTITGGGAAFPTTNINQLSFVGNTVAPQNIVLPACVPQGAAVNATLTCPETAGAGAAVPRVWTLNCPQAAVGNTPPTITYNPMPGATINVASAAATTIVVGCPTDGTGVACNGTGTGVPATSRLVSVNAVYAGPQFSPLPTMSCSFVTENGGVAVAPLDFVGVGPDAGDVVCTCPTVTVAEPFTVTVNEQIAGGAINPRVFNLVCGTGTCAGTISAPPTATPVVLNNGGAGVTVSTVTTAGYPVGVTSTVSCALSNVTGATFTVTTTPSPLVLGNGTGNVSATCTNSAQTAGSATLTCTSTILGAPGCATLNQSYTLSCPGVAGPGPTAPFIPVPALNEQGRILLAALVLLMGLAFVGFRVRN